MSGAARRRGQARGQVQEGSEPSTRSRGASRGRRGVPNLDGPASRGTGSAPGSQGGRASNAPSTVSARSPPVPQGGYTPQGPQATGQAASIPQSPAQVYSQSAQTVAPTTGLDPARESKPDLFTDSLKNIDLPASFYNINGSYQLPTEFKRRPGLNSTGRQFNLPVNSYRVLQYPQRTIQQYDVVIGDGGEKRMVMEKAWNSDARRQATGPGMIFDGNKLAWSFNDFNEKRVMVDLDVAEGKPSRGDKNTFRVHIRKTKQFDISIINAYLNNRIQYNVSVGEAINFMDHLLREGPSQNKNMIAVKRSFFTRNGQRMDLGGGIEVFRGVYQSMRLAQGGKLIVNLDVANTCFWKPGSLVNLIVLKNKFRDPSQLAQAFNNPASAKATEKYLKKLTVKAYYNGNPMPNKEWKIKEVTKVTANTHKIAWRNPETKQETGEKVSVSAYFKRRYNVQLRMPDLPLVGMTKKDIYFPIELLNVVENQRYGAKLDEIQTANMIKFAVSPPGVRSKAIDEGKGWLNWSGDQYLQAYGLRIDEEKIVTQARILPAPGIKFGRNKIEQPGTRGKWDLRGKVFFTGNPQELSSWGIGLFPGRTRMDKAQIEKFALDFAKAYRGHGGTVANGLPFIDMLPNDSGQAVEKLFQSTGNFFKKRPQLLIFIVQDKNSSNYIRIKKSCDCRFGIVSQVMQAAQVAKGNAQYYSNVLMKVNAKLGGCTSSATPAPGSGFKSFTGPTMFIGADVSHASPGSEQASMAALTVSFDRHAGRYAAACQTNGKRVEMITEQNIRAMLGPLTQQWSTQVGGGNLPSQIYYMRDGVSEGQFAQVIKEEIPHIRAIMERIANGKGWKGKITAVVASKRHHIRSFPKQGDGDQKGNPLPGTLIEQDVTMPNEWDFYLYSHIALQGTSRPVHYTVILDEADHQPNMLQNMIYEHCYQYMRSTTSVSLHPAVYYAHLASNRAKAHEDVAAAAGPTGGPGFKQNQQPSSEASTSEVAPLIKMNNTNGIMFSMWYI